MDVHELFMSEVRRSRRAPCREEETALVALALSGDVSARHELLVGHLGFIIRTARRFRHRGVDLLDLIQEGCIGFLMGIDRFDASRNVRVLTYCGYWVYQSVSRAAFLSRLVRPPYDEMERKPTERSIETARALQHRWEELDSADRVDDSAPHDMACRKESIARLNAALALLPQRTEKVIRWRMAGKTWIELAEHLGLHRSMIGKIERDGLRELSKNLGGVEEPGSFISSGAGTKTRAEKAETRPKKNRVRKKCS